MLGTAERDFFYTIMITIQGIAEISNLEEEGLGD